MMSGRTQPAQPWSFSLAKEHYDSSPLTGDEKQALVETVRYGKPPLGISAAHYNRPILLRFQKPLFDVIALRHLDNRNTPVFQMVRREIYIQMIERGACFWEWEREAWLEIIRASGRSKMHTFSRRSLMDIAYLFGEVTDLREVGQKHASLEAARLYFGAEVIDAQIKRLVDVLVGREGQGYAQSRVPIQRLTQALGLLFLLARRPFLEDFSPELLARALLPPDPLASFQIKRVKVGLQALGLLPEEHARGAISITDMGDPTGIAEEWVNWCRAWLKARPKITSWLRHVYLKLLVVGRWLTVNHPEITSPAQWDEQIALEYVNYVCSTAQVGEYVSPEARSVLRTKKTLGKPLSPRTIKGYLSALDCFFTDLQEKPHQVNEEPPCKLVRRFNPNEAFALPSSINKLIQPDPRDIDEVIWCKLTHAAATLTEEDYSAAHSGYSLKYYRAAALLWATSARRPGEIARLQVGCIRRDWDPEMLDEQGIPLPGQDAQLCYLHLPSNKTRGPYWVPIPRYTADAVEEWEQERPFNQPKRVDRKDSAQVDFLFCVRGLRMGSTFINDSLIPVLCKRAGVPERDARGAITGHRARSTIATMLRRNGLSLDDIADFLGHADSRMVRAYARTDQFRFGRDLNRANDLMRIVEGIIDTRAAKAGQPNVFFLGGRGSDGNPRFCGNPAWEKCRHRLACLKCPMYVGATQAARLAERMEARDELFKFQTQVEMTPQEKAAAEGDLETLTSLIEADAQVPPPELPNDQFRFTPSEPSESVPSSPSQMQPDLISLGRQLATLTRELAAAEKRTDGRNATIRALKKRIAVVTEQMAALDQITSLTNPTLGT
jgi:integrase